MSESIDRMPPIAPSSEVPRVGRSEPVDPRARRRERGARRDGEAPRPEPAASPDDPTPNGDDEPGKGRTLDVRV